MRFIFNLSWSIGFKKQTLKPANNFYLVSKDYFIFCKGVIINLLNPKVLLFMAILPQCITIDAPDAKYQIFTRIFILSVWRYYSWINQYRFVDCFTSTEGKSDSKNVLVG